MTGREPNRTAPANAPAPWSFSLPREMVLASAGSGKTFRLSSRLIGLMAREDVDPDAVWASTFTRKAAAEIMERVLVRLAEGALDPVKAEELAAWAWLDPDSSPTSDFLDPDHCARLLAELVHSLHRTNIGTLDSFFVQVATTFARELGLPPAWRLVDGPEDDRMRSDVLEVVLSQKGARAISDLIRIMSKGEVRRGIHGHLLDQVEHLLQVHREVDPSAKDAWTPSFAGVESGLTPEQTRRRCDRLAAAIEAAQPPLTAAGKPNNSWKKELERLAEKVRVRDWKKVFGTGLAKKLVDSGELISGDQVVYYRHSPNDELAAVLDEVAGVARMEAARDITSQLAELERLAIWYRDVFEEAQETRGGYRFGDITHVLRNPAIMEAVDALSFRLNARILHILLDEFQDTSLPQWEVLDPMVRRLLEGKETERAAVIVADPKQSIYGWRGARPSLVNEVRKSHGLKSDQLGESFRSGPVIVDTVKKVFEGLETDAVVQEIQGGPAVVHDWLKAFYPQVAHDESRPGFAEIRVGPPKEGRKGTQAALLSYAASLIGELHHQNDRASIGVLVRTNKVVTYLIQTLRKLGIPASGEGGTPLTDAAPVNGLLALLHLADHPGDSLARYHVAETPVGKVAGFTDYQSGSDARRLARTIRGRLLRDGYGVTLDGWAKELEPSCDALERARLLQLVELGFQWDAERTLRPVDFVRFVEERRVEDPSGARVRVMTVHQAKGLQFDVVVLPHLYGSLEGMGDRGPVSPLRDDTSGRIVRVYPSTDQATRVLLPELQVAHDQNRAFRLRDELSALYVAMTRARYALHMVVPADGERGPGSTKSAARILRNALVPGEAAAQEGVALGRPMGDSEWFKKLKPREFSGVAPSRPDRPAPLVVTDPVVLKDVPGPRQRNLARRSPSSMEGGEALDLATHLRLDLKGDARLRGTVVHAWCEALEWMDEGLPGDSVLFELARKEAPGVAEDRIRQWLSDFRVWMEAPAIREVLSRSAYGPGAGVERELPFLHRLHNEILQGYIDRLVLTQEEGRVVGAEILDFKTDLLDGDDADAVEGKIAFYKPQIDAYRAAVAGRYDLKPVAVTGKLLFLRPGLVSAV